MKTEVQRRSRPTSKSKKWSCRSVRIPNEYYVKPAPNIRQYLKYPHYGSWVCKECWGLNEYCYCLDPNEGDPICDCGWPAYNCHCSEEYWLRK